MNHFLVRLVACGAIAGSISATALADASIAVTGPGSTNIVSNRSSNFESLRTLNRVNALNFNSQWASTGSVRAFGNTWVGGLGGSGNATNFNSGRNNVEINNNSGFVPAWNWGSGSGGSGGTIFLTGPRSFNRISNDNSNRFVENTTNNVAAINSNQQNARSGGVVVTGNTVVNGPISSGNAANFNSGSNDVNISNSSAVPVGFGSGSWGGSGISTTGPGSANIISNSNRNSFSQNTSNNVLAANVSRQNATTGNVLVSGNTVVNGVGGSGDATNWNMGDNGVGISN